MRHIIISCKCVTTIPEGSREQALPKEEAPEYYVLRMNIQSSPYGDVWQFYINEQRSLMKLNRKRNDNKVFHYDKISQANVTPTVNYTEVNGKHICRFQQ